VDEKFGKIPSTWRDFSKVWASYLKSAEHFADVTLKNRTTLTRLRRKGSFDERTQGESAS
jgi:hypothetical protein